MARRDSYSPIIGEKICQRLAGGENLYEICKEDGFPSTSTVFQWLMHHTDFERLYYRARQYWAEAQFEQAVQVSRTPAVGVVTKTDGKGNTTVIEADNVEHRKLLVQTIQWGLTRVYPARYSERINQSISGADGKALKLVVEHIRGNTD